MFFLFQILEARQRFSCFWISDLFFSGLPQGVSVQLRVERKIVVAEGASWWLLKAVEVKSEEQVEAKDIEQFDFFCELLFSMNLGDESRKYIFIRESPKNKPFATVNCLWLGLVRSKIHMAIDLSRDLFVTRFMTCFYLRGGFNMFLFSPLPGVS